MKVRGSAVNLVPCDCGMLGAPVGDLREPIEGAPPSQEFFRSDARKAKPRSWSSSLLHGRLRRVRPPDIARGGVVLAGVRPLLDGGKGILWAVRRYIINDEN